MKAVTGFADPTLEAKARRLDRSLRRTGGLAVAFSGGVDSSVLLHAAFRALGARAVGVIADSPSLPRSELADARAFARELGCRVEVLATDELSVERYRRNEGERCYWCRRTLFEAMEEWAAREGFPTLAYGEITDDLLDVRPGRRAANELGVVAPLREAGFSKDDVRAYARSFQLPVADKPAAACLASRVPLGSEVTRERLGRIEQAEERVRALGFEVLRVRDHGALARVEVGRDELARARALSSEVAEQLRALDFARVELSAYRAPGAGARVAGG